MYGRNDRKEGERSNDKSKKCSLMYPAVLVFYVWKCYGWDSKPAGGNDRISDAYRKQVSCSKVWKWDIL